MRTLTAALQAAHAAPVQRPAWLVEIAFGTPARLSSYGAVTALGYGWQGYDVRVDGIEVEALAVRGRLSIGNADDVLGALVLNDGVADRRIRIWGYDAAAVADADFELLVDCVGGGAEIDHRRVDITLRDAADYTASPRTFVDAAGGFTHLLAAGTVLKIGGQTITLGRE